MLGAPHPLLVPQDALNPVGNIIGFYYKLFRSHCGCICWVPGLQSHQRPPQKPHICSLCPGGRSAAAGQWVPVVPSAQH